MVSLRILAEGDNKQAEAQARGKLFEALMTDVLGGLGYDVDAIPNSNYAGMEIDIDGTHSATGIPMYAECKCYAVPITAPKVQAFIGKYMAKWFQDKRAHGLFFAIPTVNSHAKAFLKEYFQNSTEVTVNHYGESEAVDFLFRTNRVPSLDTVAAIIKDMQYTIGDSIILYTDRGCYLVVYLSAAGATMPKDAAVFSSDGVLVQDVILHEYLTKLEPELQDYTIIKPEEKTFLPSPAPSEISDEIVEVRGSSACFEYQFPASPQYLVGRTSILEEIESYIDQVVRRETSSRGLLLEADSGWGKSSCILACVERLRQSGHLAIAIDSRTASSSHFVLGAIQHSLQRFRDIGEQTGTIIDAPVLAGQDSAAKIIIEAGRAIRDSGKVMLIVLDQFENLFFQPRALARIRDLLFKLHDAQTGVVLGFSWKTDLLSIADTFPWQVRDDIISHCKRIRLSKFAETETNEMLDRLRDELGARLRADLQFLLSEFSQGYPWLLKKLCAHVISQRTKGVTQKRIANSLLNVKELFDEDLNGLTADELHILTVLAKRAPLDGRDLGEDIDGQVIESLVNRRLVVRIGTKYDIYWDVFRDFLVSGSLPVQANYMLRVRPNLVLSLAKRLCEHGGELAVHALLVESKLTENSFYNVCRDLRLLGFAELSEDGKKLAGHVGVDPDRFMEESRGVAKASLQANRLSAQVLQHLSARGPLTVVDISGILKELCPYVSASDKTWRHYSLAMMDWLDFAELSLYDNKNGIIVEYVPGKQLRERNLSLLRRRGGGLFPTIQYNPVRDVLFRLLEAVTAEQNIDWGDLKKSTIGKSLVTLEDLGFVIRGQQSIDVTDLFLEIAFGKLDADDALANSVRTLSLYAKFLAILQDQKSTGATHKLLAQLLIDEAKLDWRPGTGQTNVKIMLDWARHTAQAPGHFAKTFRGPFRGNDKLTSQTDLPL